MIELELAPGRRPCTLRVWAHIGAYKVLVWQDSRPAIGRAVKEAYRILGRIQRRRHTVGRAPSQQKPGGHAQNLTTLAVLDQAEERPGAARGRRIIRGEARRVS